MNGTSILKSYRDSLPRYRVRFDKNTSIWRIYDLWNESLASISDENTDIPDDSPGVIILTDGMYMALIEESNKQGITFQLSPEESVLKTSKEMAKELKTEDNSQQERTSEKYQFCKDLMNTYLKLSSLEKVGEIKNEIK